MIKTIEIKHYLNPISEVEIVTCFGDTLILNLALALKL